MTVFIKKGDAPLSKVEAESRGKQLLDSQMAPFEREAASAANDPNFMAWAYQWSEDNKINAENNLFNHQLYARDLATARLSRYVLSEGQKEVTEYVDVGNLDEDGNPIMETVIIVPEVAPVQKTVKSTKMDEETGVEKDIRITNPEITKDLRERAEAQAVLDNLPQEVIDYVRE